MLLLALLVWRCSVLATTWIVLMKLMLVQLQNVYDRKNRSYEEKNKQNNTHTHNELLVT